MSRSQGEPITFTSMCNNEFSFNGLLPPAFDGTKGKQRKRYASFVLAFDEGFVKQFGTCGNVVHSADAFILFGDVMAPGPVELEGGTEHPSTSI